MGWYNQDRFQQTLDDAKFAKETREAVLAQIQIIGLVAKQANEIQPEVSRVADEVKKFECFLYGMKDDLQREYQTFVEEVARLRIQANLPVLADKAISEGDKVALEEITRIAQAETDMNALKRQQ